MFNKYSTRWLKHWMVKQLMNIGGVFYFEGDSSAINVASGCPVISERMRCHSKTPLMAGTLKALCDWQVVHS